jgi:class 3 adenylate cyclase
MKRVGLVAATSLAALVIIGFTTWFNFPMEEWARPLVVVPVALSGLYFRRTGSILTSLMLLLSLAPFFILQYSRATRSGTNFVFASFALMGAGVYLGHVLKTIKESRENVSGIIDAMKKFQDNPDSDSLLAALEENFEHRASAASADVFLFDDIGGLRPRCEPLSDPLPADHLFYEVARSGRLFVSRFAPGDPRVQYYGPSDNSGQLDFLAVFPLVWSGSVRGVIAVADSSAERFGADMVSYLSSIKRAMESSIEHAELLKITINHEINREKILDTFSSYVSKRVAEQILKDPDKLDLGGSSAWVTVFFAEVANFRELSKNMDAAILLDMLSEYFSMAMDAIFERDGTIDKFIGDNIMAYWGAPLPDSEGEKKAVECAIRLREGLTALNHRWAQKGLPEFNVAIGVNSGHVVAGNIGSIRRMEYTVIGDTVNLTSRIKSLSSSSREGILVGETVYNKLKDHFQFGGSRSVNLKGKTDQVIVYSLNS